MNKRRQSLVGRAKDPISFGLRLKFIDLPLSHAADDEPDSAQPETVPWPCLAFTSIHELLGILSVENDGDYISCTRRQHRLTVELLRHIYERGGSYTDPVYFLFGSRTPGGNRLFFADVNNCCFRGRRLVANDYRSHITTAVDCMEQEAAFLDALDETAPILTNLLAEEALRQDYLPGPGEHAPAA